MRHIYFLCQSTAATAIRDARIHDLALVHLVVPRRRPEDPRRAVGGGSPVRLSLLGETSEPRSATSRVASSPSSSSRRSLRTRGGPTTTPSSSASRPSSSCGMASGCSGSPGDCGRPAKLRSFPRSRVPVFIPRSRVPYSFCVPAFRIHSSSGITRSECLTLGWRWCSRNVGGHLKISHKE